MELDNPFGSRAIHRAARAGDLEGMRRELDAGVIPDDLTEWGARALAIVCDSAYEHGGSEETRVRGVRMLIEAGASVKLDSSGYRPLGIAAASGFLKIVRMLLEAGADVHEASPYERRTALHDAVAYNMHLFHRMYVGERARVRSAFDIAAALLAAGADPNAVANARTTPLLEATMTRRDPSRQHMYAVLLRGGARLDRYDREEIQINALTRSPYIDEVYDAGGWKRYAQAHRKRLADMFAPKLRLPADVIPLVVDFWANVGMY